MLNDHQLSIIEKANKIVVCQAENPDGDSLGSALALEEIFSEMDKEVYLHCPVQIPTYLRYMKGWDRVYSDWPIGVDLIVIVDTSSATLMSKTISNPVAINSLSSNPVLVLDHHVGVEPDLPFEADYVLSDTAVATGELIYNIAIAAGWSINSVAASCLYSSIQADSLGLTTVNTTADSFQTCAELVRLGASPSDIESDRRMLMKKSPRVLKYKGRLIDRIDYYNDGRTSLVHIPFEEIHEYSNEYNPTMLVIDEMRLVNGVDLAIGIKTYPDGKLTGKIRSNIPVANLLAKAFGGDGHAYAAGFRSYMTLEEFIPEMVATLYDIYVEYDEQITKDKESELNDRQPVNQSAVDTNNLGSFKLKRKTNK